MHSSIIQEVIDLITQDEYDRLYEEYYKIKSDKTFVIHNAIPEHKFGTLLKSFKNTTTLAERDKEIAFVGSYRPTAPGRFRLASPWAPWSRQTALSGPPAGS